jgi:hypothetical protein
MTEDSQTLEQTFVAGLAARLVGEPVPRGREPHITFSIPDNRRNPNLPRPTDGLVHIYDVAVRPAGHE